MKIGIYNGSEGAVIGGTEFCTTALAEFLGRKHDVEILHEKPSMTLADLERFHGTPLPRTRVTKLPSLQPDVFPQRWAWQRYEHEQKRTDAWSAPYDLFVAFTHRVPPFCASPRGFLVSLFPFSCAPEKWSRAGDTWIGKLRERYHFFMWQRRMNSYRVRTAISEYSRKWTRLRWQTECGIFHPPCNTSFSRVEKQPRILSVGRITEMKCQLEMLDAYHELKRQAPNSWEYRTVGPLGTDPANLAYFEKAKARAAESGAKIATELSRRELTQNFETAALFWHGAGYKERPDPRPEFAEHFGITTVEAMAAGCVPLVINRGGQPELVRHGVDGFVWNTPTELVAYTRQLQGDPALVHRMSESSRLRAQHYSCDAFLKNFEEMVLKEFGLKL